jgi:hypothetical protein
MGGGYPTMGGGYPTMGVDNLSASCRLTYRTDKQLGTTMQISCQYGCPSAGAGNPPAIYWIFCCVFQ